MAKGNNKAVLFLYEGETEGEFYPIIFRNYLDLKACKIRLSSKCLYGNFNINLKVLNAIDNYLSYLKNKGEVRELHIYVALDRDKRAEFMAPIDVDLIKRKIKSNLVKSVETIVATQDFESWLFIDIENIYKFLKAPVASRNTSKYKNHESFNNRDLSKLFSQHNKEYQKGRKVEGLLNALNIKKIYDNCEDLRNGIKSIKKLCDK